MRAADARGVVIAASQGRMIALPCVREMVGTKRPSVHVMRGKCGGRLSLRPHRPGHHAISSLIISALTIQGAGWGVMSQPLAPPRFSPTRWAPIVLGFERKARENRGEGGTHGLGNVYHTIPRCTNGLR